MKALAWLLGLALCTACASETATTTASQPTAHIALAERGKALFRNKGCATCHVNKRLEGETGIIAMGPVLTDYTNDPVWLRRWLHDPQSVRPGTQMPNLQLAPDEIEDLIAFLNQTQE